MLCLATEVTMKIIDRDGDQISVSEFSGTEICISVFEVDGGDPRAVVLDRERVTRLVAELQDWLART